MKDYISELKKAKDLYKNSTLHIDLNNKVNDAKNKIKKQHLELQEMEQNISLKERKKVMHKTEILKNKILAEKNNERFNAENNKHLENCQEQVKIEAAIYNTEDEIETLKSTMKELEQKLSESKVCLHDKIFLELIKGLGVEYNESEKSFVVRNITKNEIRTFKASDKNLTDKIWGFLAI